jgi:hypothetical protein
MSAIKTPRFWLLAAATLSGLWITFRVINADAAQRPALPHEEVVEYQEIADPALSAMIHRFAAQAQGHGREDAR